MINTNINGTVSCLEGMCQVEHKSSISANGVSLNQVHINYVEDRTKNLENRINEMQNLLDSILNKEEEDDTMMEAINIVRLYKNNKEEEYRLEHDKKMKEYKESNVFIAQYDALVNEYSDKLIELYASQLPDGVLENNVDNHMLALIHDPEATLRLPVIKNIAYDDDKMREIDKELENKMVELHNMTHEAETMLGVCSTRDEIMEVLKEYKIVDKNGRLKK